MKVHLKCFATIADAEACDYKESTEFELSAGQTVEDLIARLDVPRDDINIIFVNNRVVDADEILNDGDRVGLAPTVGAM